MKVAFGHTEYAISDNDMLMVKAIPQGGNWRDIPVEVPSKRLEQIRDSGGRTTLYGRLAWDRPCYTITTYFNRPGNGCYIHPQQNRVLTSLEAARLQSFPDSFIFSGSKTSRTKQIGNAVPPLMAFAIGKKIKREFPQLSTVLDLFAGAGGLSLGFHWAGLETIVANDISKDAVATYANNFPEATSILGDIREPEVAERILSEVKRNGGADIIVGGPPCQGFSTAGRRMIDDPRNQLYKEFVKTVAFLKPKIVVMENVAGLLSSNNGHTYTEIIENFEELGYLVEGRKLLAADYGVPQKRNRVIIIASKLKGKSDLFPTPLLKPGDFMSVKDAISDIPQETKPGVDDPVPLGKASCNYQRLVQGEISAEEFCAYSN